MNKILQLSFVAVTALFLFACDSSTSTKKTDTGGGGTPTTYSVSANVTGLGANTLIITNTLNTNEKSFNTDGQSEILSGLAANSSYGISLKSDPMGKTCTLGPNAASNSISTDVIVSVSCSDVAITGDVGNGMAYYMSECSVCHRAGGITVDASSTFGTNGDLAGDYKIAVGVDGGVNFFNNIHLLGPQRNLMGRFNMLKPQSLADLKAYLLSIAP